MEIRESQRLARLPSYPLARVRDRIEDLKRQGVRPIDFGIGDPREETPAFIREAAIQGVERHKLSGYPTFGGGEELRRAIAAWFERRFSVELDVDHEICVTIGSKEAIFNAHEGFVDPGDVVFGPSPGYPPYRLGALFAEGNYVPYAMNRQTDYLPDLDRLATKAEGRARVFWANYPHSPSGRVASLSELRAMKDFASRQGALFFSDEAYSEIYFEHKPHSALELGKEGTLVFQSLSKRSAMTGYRVGFVAGDARLVQTFRRVKMQVDTGTSWFIQDAATAALGDEAHVASMREAYRWKRDRLVEAFTSLGLEECRPQGAMYLWQRVPEGMGSVEFAERLLDPKLALVVTPGAWIGDEVDGINPGENYVRIALVPTKEETDEAVSRLAGLSFER